MNVIIKSPIKGKENWSGKEFSGLPAKIYSSFEAAVDALNAYCFFEYDTNKNEYVETPDERKVKDIRIIHLTESRERALLAAGKIRW